MDLTLISHSVDVNSPRNVGAEAFAFERDNAPAAGGENDVRQLHLRNSKRSLTQRFKDRVRHSIRRPKK